MLLRIPSIQKRKLKFTPVQPVEIVAHERAESVSSPEADLRRQMYERIAQGNALAEIEDKARRMWRGD